MGKMFSVTRFFVIKVKQTRDVVLTTINKCKRSYKQTHIYNFHNNSNSLSSQKIKMGPFLNLILK